MVEAVKVKKEVIFSVHKGNRVARWKVIEHPFFDSLALVRDYSDLYGTMKDGYSKRDESHICCAVSLGNAYQTAYDMT